MELLIFKSKMSALLNGSLPNEFTVQRGLTQGDPFSLFFFSGGRSHGFSEESDRDR